MNTLYHFELGEMQRERKKSKTMNQNSIKGNCALRFGGKTALPKTLEMETNDVFSFLLYLNVSISVTHIHTLALYLHQVEQAIHFN